jgi:hypothetical protein
MAHSKDRGNDGKKKRKKKEKVKLEAQKAVVHTRIQTPLGKEE